MGDFDKPPFPGSLLTNNYDGMSQGYPARKFHEQIAAALRCVRYHPEIRARDGLASGGQRIIQ